MQNVPVTFGKAELQTTRRKDEGKGLAQGYPGAAAAHLQQPRAGFAADAEAARGRGVTEVARVNASFIAIAEKKAIAAILPRIPASTKPIHLTALALAGAVLTAAALVCCTWWNWAVVLVPLGLFIHWFGDSLDGSLARYRKIERPSFGFFVDHTSDLFGLSLIILSFGFSPFFSLVSALLVLTMYLLFSAYTYVKVAVAGVHQLAYGGLGCTEFRLLMAGWALFAAAVQPHFLQARLGSVQELDLVIGVLSAVAFCCLVYLFVSDMDGIDQIDRRAAKSRPVADARQPRAPLAPGAKT